MNNFIQQALSLCYCASVRAVFTKKDGSVFHTQRTKVENTSLDFTVTPVKGLTRNHKELGSVNFLQNGVKKASIITPNGIKN
mmetsp:Transcript_2012/g.4487  ORF Transcript_2012/g.4487 Transcript_2012/m.4487 type:complete len:82 (-) Transcript_2012:362-607(-)